MKHFFILFLVAAFLFVLGQTLFCQKPAASSEDAIVISSDMRRSEQARYLLEQARRFYQQGRFGDVFDVAAYAKDKLGFELPEMAELFSKARLQLEEEALVEAERLQQRVKGMVDLR